MHFLLLVSFNAHLQLFMTFFFITLFKLLLSDGRVMHTHWWKVEFIFCLLVTIFNQKKVREWNSIHIGGKIPKGEFLLFHLWYKFLFCKRDNEEALSYIFIIAAISTVYMYYNEREVKIMNRIVIKV